MYMCSISVWSGKLICWVEFPLKQNDEYMKKVHRHHHVKQSGLTHTHMHNHRYITVCTHLLTIILIGILTATELIAKLSSRVSHASLFLENRAMKTTDRQNRSPSMWIRKQIHWKNSLWEDGDSPVHRDVHRQAVI